MEGHPEEDDHGEHQAEGHDALLGLLIRQLWLIDSGSGLGVILLLAALRVAESGAEHVIDGYRQDERRAGHGKGEVIGVVARIAQGRLGILLNPDGCRRGKQGTDIDGHIEEREAGVALRGILRVIIEIAHHHLQVALEQACAQANEHERGQHHHEGQRVAAKGHGQQQIAGKHDEDAHRHHAPKAELVGHDTTNERQKIHQHEE